MLHRHVVVSPAPVSQPTIQPLGNSTAIAGAKVHWYGKAGMRKGRKVGHINVVAPNRAEGRRRLAGLDPSAAAALEKSGEAMRRLMTAAAGEEVGASQEAQVRRGFV
jgi:phosphoribosylaminoimidazole carboxylase